jgi:hypothetical protein
MRIRRTMKITRGSMSHKNLYHKKKSKNMCKGEGEGGKRERGRRGGRERGEERERG